MTTASLPSPSTAAREAVIQTLPVFEMMRMRAATTARRHPELGFASEDRDSRMRWVNQFTHTHRKLGPDDREVVSPNNDTVYSNAWLDLSQGPVLVGTPEMGERYWVLGLLDAWTNPFAYVGRRTTGNLPQRTLMIGPGWKGTVPADVTNVIAAPGHDVWIIGRILVDDEPADIESVRRLQAQIVGRRLDDSDAAMRVDTRLDGRSLAVPSPAIYRAIVDEALARNPVPEGERLRWPLDEDELATELPRVFEQLRQQVQPHSLGNGWALQVAVRDHWGGDVSTRARIARNFIGALGIEEAMYPAAEVDADGEPLHGSRAYELCFAPGRGLRVGAFWSLTMYRRRDCLFVANPIARYSIGDRTPGLKLEPDGRLVIRLQADDPGPGCNWLPAPRDEPFYVVLRLYQPQADHLEYRYAYPPLRRV
jgi:hypothetical protein